MPCDPACPLRRRTLVISPESPQPWGMAWPLRAHLARRALARSWPVGSKRWTGPAVIPPRGCKVRVVPVNLEAHGLSKAPHLGHPRSPSSPSDEAPPREGRNAQTSPRRDTAALRGLSQPAEVRGRPGFYTLGDGGSPPGSWSLALPQHPPTPLSLVLAYPGGADSLGGPQPALHPAHLLARPRAHDGPGATPWLGSRWQQAPSFGPALRAGPQLPPSRTPLHYPS